MPLPWCLPSICHHAIAMPLPWNCGAALVAAEVAAAVAAGRRGTSASRVTKFPRSYRAVPMRLPCCWHALDMLLPCSCRVIVMQLPCTWCHALAMQLPCPCHAQDDNANQSFSNHADRVIFQSRGRSVISQSRRPFLQVHRWAPAFRFFGGVEARGDCLSSKIL